jgi:hypothetical protein
MTYKDHSGNEFEADILRPCPFCFGEAAILFTGNDHTKKRTATARCTHSDCRAEMTNATLRHNTEWVAKVTIEAWNKRSSLHRINLLESGSFEYWTAEQKQGYLTALRSLKDHLS